MFKKIFFSIFILFIWFQTVSAENTEQPILFYWQWCPHCSKVEKFIENNNLYKNILQKEIYQNPENAQEFNKICEQQNIWLMNRGVPFLYAEKKCFIWDKQIINYLNWETNKTEKEVKKDFLEKLTLPVLIGAALVDAINPCAFAVLLILMTTVLVSGNRKRALLSGLFFSASIFISYFLMWLGLYSIIASIETSWIFMKTIGFIAILLWLFNLKDFFWYGKVFLMEVPNSWRPKLKSLIGSITSPLGAFFIWFLVSLFLLPCTSWPYIVIIWLLWHKTEYLKAVWLLGLYNLIFILPMIWITLWAYFWMNVKNAEEKRVKNLKILHLIAGIIMLWMWAYLIIWNI